MYKAITITTAVDFKCKLPTDTYIVLIKQYDLCSSIVYACM